MTGAVSEALARFGVVYAAQRAAEGRAHKGAALRSLPYLSTGPLSKQWRVRARSFEALLRRVVVPLAGRKGAPLEILDLGAGNGWLSYRLACRGHRCTAIDIRTDEVDGLGAARELQRACDFRCIAAAFDALPLPSETADLAVFNASLHYATDLAAVLAEAARCLRPGGVIAVVDSPFYRSAADGEAMVREKRLTAGERFGERAASLISLPTTEYLTRERLERALPLRWRRRRVIYPAWYELRPLLAWLSGARRPSRFDIWTTEVP
ncbi:MAG: class I SAM-dependent methyltransferase [Porphyrobacter sp.]|nr:class I SAM-dependent methyltransferase [Porphyrobacter sp.]